MSSSFPNLTLSCSSSGSDAPELRKLDSDMCTLQAKLLQDCPQILRRVGLLGVEPDAHVIVERGSFGLAKISFELLW